MVMHASREPLFCQLPGGLSKLVHFKLKHPSEPFRSLRGRGVNWIKFAWILVSDETLKGRFFVFFHPFHSVPKSEISRFAAFSLCALGKCLLPLVSGDLPLAGVGGGCQFCGRALPPVWTGFYLWSLAPKHLSRQKLRIWAAFEIVFSVKSAFKTFVESLT